MRLGSPDLNARFRLGIGATAILSGTLMVTLSSPVWAGWGLVAAGMLAMLSGRPSN
jgi:hypothetical protein